MMIQSNIQLEMKVDGVLDEEGQKQLEIVGGILQVTKDLMDATNAVFNALCTLLDERELEVR